MSISFLLPVKEKKYRDLRGAWLNPELLKRILNDHKTKLAESVKTSIKDPANQGSSMSLFREGLVPCSWVCRQCSTTRAHSTKQFVQLLPATCCHYAQVALDFKRVFTSVGVQTVQQIKI